MLILGGQVGGVATSSGWLVTPSVPAQVTALPNVLSVARAGHRATLVPGGVLVCGGSTTAVDFSRQK